MTFEENTITDIIAAALLAGRLSPGLRLGEQQLATRFGVTRERIRKVLHRLGHQHLIDLQPNRGAFVAEPGLREAREIYQARRIIEAGIVGHLALTITESQVNTLEAHVEREQQSYDARDRAESVRLSGAFHGHLAEMTGNAFVVRSLQELVGRTAMLVAYHEGGAQGCGCAEHRSILRAMGARDPAAASREMHLHLSLIETRLQVPPVVTLTSDLDAILAEEIERWTAARRTVKGPENPRRQRSKASVLTVSSS
jgi:DNA-binding GntR family transcriptional regulator